MKTKGSGKIVGWLTKEKLSKEPMRMPSTSWRLLLWKLRWGLADWILPKAPVTTIEEDETGNEVEQVMLDVVANRIRQHSIRENDIRRLYLREYLNKQSSDFVGKIYKISVETTTARTPDDWTFDDLLDYCGRLFITEYINDNRNDMSFVAPGKMESQED